MKSYKINLFTINLLLAINMQAQSVEKVIPEIQGLISNIKMDNSELKRLSLKQNTLKVFDYLSYRNGTPPEKRYKGFEKQFDYDRTKIVNQELSTFYYKIFEDGTVMIPIEFNEREWQEGKQFKEEEINAHDTFIKKYQISFISEEGGKVFVIFPLSYLELLTNDPFIKKVGNKFGVYIIGEVINGKDEVWGYDNDKVMRKRKMALEDSQNAFVTRGPKSKEGVKKSATNNYFEYVNELIFDFTGVQDIVAFKLLLARENIKEFELTDMGSKLIVVRIPEDQDVFLIMKRLSIYKGVYFRTASINNIGQGD